MRLCIDQGNSSTKAGIFDEQELVESLFFDQFGEKEIQALFKEHPIQSCIFSTVSTRDERVIACLRKHAGFFMELAYTTPIPIRNGYGSPETLGNDRLAGVIGAAFLKPATDILVIDAGSAITYDFIDAHGVYRGGNIAPGMDLRLRSLHAFTQKLPLVAPQTDSPFIGTDTKSAILSGVLYGIVFEIDGYIDAFKKQYPELSIFLTGGSTIYFVDKLKNAIFANKNLVLIGLNRILQYNEQN